MTIVGFVLFAVGAGVGGMIFTGNAPMAIASLPVPLWLWCAMAGVGAAMMYLNRRPGN